MRITSLSFLRAKLHFTKVNRSILPVLLDSLFDFSLHLFPFIWINSHCLFLLFSVWEKADFEIRTSSWCWRRF